MSFAKRWTQHGPHVGARFRARLNLETLESRIVPYNLSGGAWLHPALVTVSFVPDGTDLGGVSSNLFATFNANGQAYDLQTVALHEFGHALGLGHSTATGAAMNAGYSKVQQSLGSDDVSGIRANYSASQARSADRYDVPSNNNTFSAASDL